VRTDTQIKKDLTDTLTHLRSVLTALRQCSGKNKTFTFPGAHKIAEGLLLRAWTEWEAFLRELLVSDFSSDVAGSLRREIKKFRTIAAPERLAERLLNHPDSPEKFVEWNYADVFRRADDNLGAGHRFPKSLKTDKDLERLKRMRNSIAHRSDKAWDSFMKLVLEAPFSLAKPQRAGITPGRFIFSHKWGESFVLEKAFDLIEDSCKELVP
jgi:hypothetical protein